MVEKAKGKTKNKNQPDFVSMDLRLMVKNLVEAHTLD